MKVILSCERKWRAKLRAQRVEMNREERKVREDFFFFLVSFAFFAVKL